MDLKIGGCIAVSTPHPVSLGTHIFLGRESCPNNWSSIIKFSILLSVNYTSPDLTIVLKEPIKLGLLDNFYLRIVLIYLFFLLSSNVLFSQSQEIGSNVLISFIKSASDYMCFYSF